MRLIKVGKSYYLLSNYDELWEIQNSVDYCYCRDDDSIKCVFNTDDNDCAFYSSKELGYVEGRFYKELMPGMYMRVTKCIGKRSLFLISKLRCNEDKTK